MGGTTSTQSTQQQQTQSSPYAPTQPMLQDIINSLGGLSTSPSAAQTSATGTLQSEASQIPNLGGAASTGVSSILGSNYSPYQGILSGAYSDYGNTVGGLLSGLSGVGSNYGSLMGNLGNLAGSLGNVFGTAGSLAGSVPSTYAPVTSAYSNYLNPNYTNPYTNPALSSAMSTMNQDITNQINGQFAAAGRSGSPDNTQALARGLSQGEGGLLTNEYNQLVGQQLGGISGLSGTLGQELGAQTGLLGLQGSLGQGIGSIYGEQGTMNQGLANTYGLEGNLASGLYGAGSNTATGLAGLQSSQNANILSGLQGAGMLSNLYTQPGQAQLAAAMSAYGIPYQDISTLESLINPIAGLGGQYAGTSSGTTSQTSPWYTTALGAGLLGAGLFSGGTNSAYNGILNAVPSDRRIKRDIEQIGSTFDGLPIYLFRYIGDPLPRIGLMAQDVEKVCPDAVVEMGGIKAVNYEIATRNARHIGGHH